MKLYISIAVGLLILTGCNAEPEVENTKSDLSEVQAEGDSQVESENKTEEVVETEMTGTGQSTAFIPYTSTAKVTLVGDDIIDVEFEEFLEDGTSKNVASKEGTYTSPNYTLGEFYEQVDSLEQYVIDNDKFPTLSNGTDNDGVSGASVNLSGFEEAFNLAVSSAK